MARVSGRTRHGHASRCKAPPGSSFRCSDPGGPCDSQTAGAATELWLLTTDRSGEEMRIFRPAVLAFGLALGCASVAGAFTVPPSSIADGNEGEVRLLWTQTVDPADVGKDCDVVLVSTNNESTREGTDLILQSGSSSMLASNVEHDTEPHTFADRLTLGTTITVSVRFGPEGMYSGSSDVETNCPLPEAITAPPAVESETVGASAPVAVPVRPVFTG